MGWNFRKGINMLNIEQFRYGDNLAYLIFGQTEAMAIDGGGLWRGSLAHDTASPPEIGQPSVGSCPTPESSLDRS